MKTKILILFLAVVRVMVQAQVNYAIDGNTAYVTNSPDAAGEVVIASTYNGYPVTSIRDQAFQYCISLTNVTIPDSVTSIGVHAFYNCGLTSVSIPNGVTTIGEDAFADSFLTSVTLGKSLTNIGAEAFYNCASLKSVTIGSSVTDIGDGAFQGASLTSVTIPNSVTSIGEDAFLDYLSLTKIEVAVDNPAYSSVNGVLFDKTQTTLIEFPGSLGGSYAVPDSVTSIGDDAFENCDSLTNIAIPDSVTNIGVHAFYSCGLTSVMIGNGVIGDEAFYNCGSLKSVTIGNNVTSIGEFAFEYCGRLTGVTIGSSVANFVFVPFYECTSLTNIAVAVDNPAYTSVNGVLFDKKQTTLIEFPGGLGGHYAIPNTVTTIGDDAFFDCESLTSVTIANSVTSIGENAFSQTALTNVTIPNSVTSIGDGAFSRTGLRSATLGSSVTNIGDAFANSGLTSITIPNSVTSIEEDAFESCYYLTNISIPNSVTSIGNSAFYYCPSLQSVTIGNSVTNIAEGAFEDCTGLANLTFLGNAPALRGNVFYDASGYAVVYYYYGTSGWDATYGGLPTVELFPPQIGNGSTGVQSGNFGFTITGVTNQTVIVEASTNLVNWQPIWTNMLSGTTTNFTDAQWTNYPSRFYRISSRNAWKRKLIALKIELWPKIKLQTITNFSENRIYEKTPSVSTGSDYHPDA